MLASPARPLLIAILPRSQARAALRAARPQTRRI